MHPVCLAGRPQVALWKLKLFVEYICLKIFSNIFWILFKYFSNACLVWICCGMAAPVLSSIQKSIWLLADSGMCRGKEHYSMEWQCSHYKLSSCSKYVTTWKNKSFRLYDKYHYIAYLNIGLLLTFVIMRNQLHNRKKCKTRFSKPNTLNLYFLGCFNRYKHLSIPDSFRACSDTRVHKKSFSKIRNR